MTQSKLGSVTAVLAAPTLVFGAMFGVLLTGNDDSTICNPASSTSVTSDPQNVPDTTIVGYDHDQLVNAAYILEAGDALGLGVRDQTIGVMTAMGESGLVVLDRGDSAGPDSRGLFQQRDNGAWGSYEDRMDPHISATNFFMALTDVANREALEPTIVAHRTQRDADPYYYEAFWDSAIAVVEGLSGVDTGLNADTGDQVCVGGSLVPGAVSATGWAVPGAGPITSSYGTRYHPVDKVWRFHNGTDLLAGGCGQPVWAAQDGTVTFAGVDSLGTGIITIDHGGGVQTSYLHEYPSGILVHEGDPVTAGQQIGRVGSSGRSTGCHLHFMVVINGSPTDPVPFMHEVGAPIS